MSNSKYSAIITQFDSVEVPKFIEHKNNNIVFFGKDNLYPYELIDLYNDSSTHNAIINGKVGYVVGNGLISDDIKAKQWLKTPNLNEDWTSILKRIELDYELFNGYAIEVIRTSAGKLYNHLDFANIRVGMDGTLKYANDWINDKGRKNHRPNIIELPKYDPTDDSQKRSIIYHTDYRPNFKYYPLPVYVGSLAEIKTDVNIGDYWLNEVENGFVGGTLIQHNNGVPETDEEKRLFEQSFADKFGNPTGTKIVHLFSPNKENSSEISSLNGNDLHERYVQMSQRVKESIFIGHRVTNPILFGVKEQGQLGGRNELDLAHEIFTKTYVQERRNTLLSTINKLCYIDTGIKGIDIEQQKPVDTFELSSNDIINNLTSEEIRNLITEKTGLQLNINTLPQIEPKENINPLEIVDETKDAEVEQKEASYNGAQISSALEIVSQVQAGILSNEQGVSFLMEFLRLNEVAARRLLRQESANLKKQFTDEDISHLFENIGQSKDDFEILESRPIQFGTDGTPIEFILGLSEMQVFILGALFESPLISLAALADILEVDVTEIEEELDAMIEDGLINSENDTLELTRKGEEAAQEEPVPDAKIMYSYELRSDAPPLKAGGTSRPFCNKMMSMNKLYSREEIDLLRNNMKSDGYSDATDVWLARGGWYNKPNSDAAVPFCRHIWEQKIVRSK